MVALGSACRRPRSPACAARVATVHARPWLCRRSCFHPLTNEATAEISRADLATFLEHIGVTPEASAH